MWHVSGRRERGAWGSRPVILAKARIQNATRPCRWAGAPLARMVSRPAAAHRGHWIPAFAGMTKRHLCRMVWRQQLRGDARGFRGFDALRGHEGNRDTDRIAGDPAPALARARWGSRAGADRAEHSRD